MAFPWIFANLAAGNQPASKLDDNFNALGTYATVPCTAAGTNAITLTPVVGTPTIGAYNQLQAYRFLAAATSSGAVTIQVLALGFLPAYYPSVSGPVAAGSGKVVIGESYDAIYDVALNSGAGGFHLYNVLGASSSGGGVRHVYGTYTANADLATVLPADDTIPTNTEGVQVITVNVTTLSATERVRLTFSAFGALDNGNDYVSAAIYQATNCIQAVAVYFNNTTFVEPAFIGTPAIEVVPGSATTTAFSVRVGPTAGNARLNGRASARLFGGIAAATLAVDIWEP